MGQLVAGDISFVVSAGALLAFFFFLWAFLGAFLTGWAAGAVACAGCSELIVADGLAAGAPDVSAAQAGAAKIKALNNSNIFFMVILPLWLKNICGLPDTGAAPRQQQQQLLPHQASLSFAYTSRPLLKRGFSRSISAYWKRASAALRTPAVNEPAPLNRQHRSASS